MGQLSAYYGIALSKLREELIGVLNLFSTVKVSDWSEKFVDQLNQLQRELADAFKKVTLQEKITHLKNAENIYNTFSTASGTLRQKLKSTKLATPLEKTFASYRVIETNLMRLTLNDIQRIARLKDIFAQSYDIYHQIRSWHEQSQHNSSYTNTLATLAIEYFEVDERRKDKNLKEATQISRDKIESNEKILTQKFERDDTKFKMIANINMTAAISALTDAAVKTMIGLEDPNCAKHIEADGLYFETPSSETNSNIYTPRKDRWISPFLLTSLNSPVAEKALNDFLPNINNELKKLIEDLYQVENPTLCASFTLLNELYSVFKEELKQSTDYRIKLYYASNQLGAGDKRSLPGAIAIFILNSLLRAMVNYISNRTLPEQNNIHDVNAESLTETYKSLCENKPYEKQLLLTDLLDRILHTLEGFISMLEVDKKTYDIPNLPQHYLIKIVFGEPGELEKDAIYLNIDDQNQMYYTYLTSENEVIKKNLDKNSLDVEVIQTLKQNYNAYDAVLDLHTQAAIFTHLSRTDSYFSLLHLTHDIKDIDLTNVTILNFYKGILDNIENLTINFNDALPFPTELLNLINAIIKDLTQVTTYELNADELDSNEPKVTTPPQKSRSSQGNIILSLSLNFMQQILGDEPTINPPSSSNVSDINSPRGVKHSPRASIPVSNVLKSQSEGTLISTSPSKTTRSPRIKISSQRE